MQRRAALIVGTTIFRLGACYGLWLQDDIVLKMVGLFFALAEIMAILAKVDKNVNTKRNGVNLDLFVHFG